MPRLSLTSKLVDNAPLPRDRKSVEYFDHRMPGLVLKVSARGTKSWNAIYRHEGRARRLTIGRYPIIILDDARARARDALCSVSRGIDPTGVRADTLTFAGLASMFVAGHVRKLRRARQVERLIEREIGVAWKNRPANSITRRDVALLVADVAERAPVLANRVLATTRRLFGWAIAQGLLETNPCDQVERPTLERARERVLTTGELRALWQALEPFREVSIPDQHVQARRRSMRRIIARGRLASVTLVVACQPTTAADPGQGALHDPSFRQHDEPVPVAAAHDLKLPTAGAGDGGLHLLPLIAGVADDVQDRDGAEALLREARRSFPFIECTLAGWT